MGKKNIKIKTNTIVSQRDGYNKIETTKSYKGRTQRSIIYETNDDEQFMAADTIKQFYDYTNEKHSDKTFHIRVLTPLGWRTVADNNGMRWTDHEDYFDGKIKDPSKFISEVEKVNIVII